MADKGAAIKPFEGSSRQAVHLISDEHALYGVLTEALPFMGNHLNRASSLYLCDGVRSLSLLVLRLGFLLFECQQ